MKSPEFLTPRVCWAYGAPTDHAHNVIARAQRLVATARITDDAERAAAFDAAADALIDAVEALDDANHVARVDAGEYCEPECGCDNVEPAR